MNCCCSSDLRDRFHVRFAVVRKLCKAEYRPITLKLIHAIKLLPERGQRHRKLQGHNSTRFLRTNRRNMAYSTRHTELHVSNGHRYILA